MPDEWGVAKRIHFGLEVVLNNFIIRILSFAFIKMLYLQGCSLQHSVAPGDLLLPLGNKDILVSAQNYQYYAGRPGN